mgnify:CR=1 FL=1
MGTRAIDGAGDGAGARVLQKPLRFLAISAAPALALTLALALAAPLQAQKKMPAKKVAAKFSISSVAISHSWLATKNSIQLLVVHVN